MVYLGLSVGILLLVWFVFDLTKGMRAVEVQASRPWHELGFALLVLVAFWLVPVSRLQFGGRWSLGVLLSKLLLFFIVPLVFLRLMGNPFASLGLTLSNWRRNLKVGGDHLCVHGRPKRLLRRRHW